MGSTKYNRQGVYNSKISGKACNFQGFLIYCRARCLRNEPKKIGCISKSLLSVRASRPLDHVNQSNNKTNDKIISKSTPLSVAEMLLLGNSNN